MNRRLDRSLADPNPRPDAAAPGTAAVQSLSRGLELLEAVCAAGEPVRLRDLAAGLGLDRSTALRLLMTLERSGFVTKDAAKRYSPGPTLARLRRFSPSHGLLVERLRPVLNGLNQATGMTTYLGVLERDHALIIEVLPSRHVVSVRQVPGDTEPLYRGAVGKSLLANLPDQLRLGVIGSMPFQRFTADTIVDADTLERALVAVRATGVAFDEGEGHEDVCCIAAAVLDDVGIPLASVGISMVRALVPDGARGQTDWIERVRDAAAEARKLLVPV